ncbi:MAG: PilZ domain-containing protein [Candidatus Omnitrophota bacterium]|jgi:c-di-GMP-binding flagellar brake protein YcgR
MSDERRKNTRTYVSFPVECSFLPSKGYFYTVSKDLSLSGTRIISNDFLPKNNQLMLNINFIDKVVDLKAKVVWCNKERTVDRYFAGLEFIEVPAEGKKYLNSIIK